MVVTWLMVSVLALIIFFLVFKTQDVMVILAYIKKYIFIILLVALIAFFSFSLYKISVNYNLDFKSFKGITYAGRVYLIWMKSLFVNFGRITGYTVQQDWVLNSTNVTG